MSPLGVFRRFLMLAMFFDFTMFSMFSMGAAFGGCKLMKPFNIMGAAAVPALVVTQGYLVRSDQNGMYTVKDLKPSSEVCKTFCCLVRNSNSAHYNFWNNVASR